MPEDVKQAFTEIVSEQGGLSSEEAAQFIRGMEKQKRYQVETWY